jgi:flagellar basal-body rod protein FlgB
MIEGLTNSTELPVLERMLQFTARRHELITNNIANLSTPGYRAQDVSVEEFQASLGEAIDARRSHGARAGVDDSMLRGVKIDDRGTMALSPTPAGDNLLFHDRNDRSVESTMSDLVSNFMAFRTTAELIRNRFDLINSAIAERP